MARLFALANSLTRPFNTHSHCAVCWFSLLSLSLSPVLDSGPLSLHVPFQTPAEKNRSIFVAVSVRVIQSCSDSNRIKVFSRRALHIAEHDNNLARVVAWSPEKIILMSTNRLGQSILWSKEIDGGSLAIIVAEDCCALLVFRRERMINARHCFNHSRPGEFVSVVLWQTFTEKASLSL